MSNAMIEEDEDRAPFLGEVKPQYGRWSWPFAWMKPGEYFIVDHARRDPEHVRVYVSVRAAQLNKRFSVAKDDPEHPGYCRVTCVPLDDQREEPEGVVMDIEKVHPKISDWYGVALNEVLPWGSLAMKRQEFIEVRQIEAPPVKRMIVRTQLHDGWFGLVFRKDGMEFHPLAPGTALKSWVLEEPSLEEIMA